MNRSSKRIVAVLIGIGAVAFLLSRPMAKSWVWRTHFQTLDDGTATVAGVVLENDRGCTVDGTCFLRLVFQGQRVNIIYGTGEQAAPGCYNAGGAGVKAGTRIQARGKHTGGKNSHTIEACGAGAYIRSL